MSECSKIETIEDLQKLLNEATPPSMHDRVRRHINVNQNTVRSHQNEKGHSNTQLPTFAGRINPKRKRSNRTQMQHGGKAGHRHSVRSQRGKPKKFTEAIDFLQNNIGKQFNKELLAEIEDKQALYTIATKLMKHVGINRDWLSNLCGILETKHD